MANKKKGGCGRTLIGLVGITIGIVICTVSLVTAIDIACANDIEYWLPVYPNSTLVEYSEDGFFRPRAMGITEAVYATEDDQLTVRNWYIDYRRAITAGAEITNSERPARGVATTSYSLSENPEGGTFIYQSAECAYN